MQYFTTDSFRKQLKKILKKDFYKSANKDINDFLSDLKLSEIIQIPIILSSKDNISLLKKTRIKNSYKRLGTRGGFRLIYVVDKQKESVILLFIYPKTNTYGQADISNKELQFLIENYNYEKENDLFLEF